MPNGEDNEGKKILCDCAVSERSARGAMLMLAGRLSDEQIAQLIELDELYIDRWERIVHGDQHQEAAPV